MGNLHVLYVRNSTVFDCVFPSALCGRTRLSFPFSISNLKWLLHTMQRTYVLSINLSFRYLDISHARFSDCSVAFHLLFLFTFKLKIFVELFSFLLVSCSCFNDFCTCDCDREGFNDSNNFERKISFWNIQKINENLIKIH